jgi:hypothetical protein
MSDLTSWRINAPLKFDAADRPRRFYCICLSLFIYSSLRLHLASSRSLPPFLLVYYFLASFNLSLLLHLLTALLYFPISYYFSFLISLHIYLYIYLSITLSLSFIQIFLSLSWVTCLLLSLLIYFSISFPFLFSFLCTSFLCFPQHLSSLYCLYLFMYLFFIYLRIFVPFFYFPWVHESLSPATETHELRAGAETSV